MRRRLLVLGLYSGAAIHPALAAQPDHDLGGLGGLGGPEPKDPSSAGAGDELDSFAFQKRLPDDFTRRAVSAGKLKDAITAPRTKLTPEHLEILVSTDRPHGPTPSIGQSTG